MSKFFITTAIDYVNAGPHIGHALEKIQADALARYHRQKGDEVFFLTGTDEHGAKIARAAEEQNKSPQELADENSARFRSLGKILGLSFDDFIRTTDRERHWPAAEKIWRKLGEAGDLYRKKYRGLYCVGHEALVTEKDLVDGKCADHQTAPETIEEENWFFRLSKYADQIKSVIERDELKIVPETRKNEALSFIKQGLEDISFSRPGKDLSWGIPAPDDPDSTMYVWCDALTNYISAIGYGSSRNIDISKFRTWWPADVHLIGKDILRFHAVIWPGMLLSAGLPLPKAIYVHGHVTVEGRKMSKTVGNVVDPVELADRYGSDPVRYYLLREIPSGEDGDFSYGKFEDRYNGDLANGLGNLVSRVTALAEKLSPVKFDFKKDIEKSIKDKCDRTFEEYGKSIENFQLNLALTYVWALMSFGDLYVNDKKPWKTEDETELRRVMANACYIVNTANNLIRPFLPDAADKISELVSFKDSVIEVKKGGLLFPRI